MGAGVLHPEREIGPGKGGVDGGLLRPQASDPPTEDRPEAQQMSGFGSGIAHWAREVVLTRDSPRDADLGIKLLKVESDGTAVIAVDRPSERLSVRPGEYVHTSAGTFGAYGLQVTSTDAARQTAVLLRRGATYYPNRGNRQ